MSFSPRKAEHDQGGHHHGGEIAGWKFDRNIAALKS
jgi:hypothetical protein